MENNHEREERCGDYPYYPHCKEICKAFFNYGDKACIKTFWDGEKMRLLKVLIKAERQEITERGNWERSVYLDVAIGSPRDKALSAAYYSARDEYKRARDEYNTINTREGKEVV